MSKFDTKTYNTNGVLTRELLESARQKVMDQVYVAPVIILNQATLNAYKEEMKFEAYCKTLFPWKEKQVRLKRRLQNRRKYKCLPLPE